MVKKTSSESASSGDLQKPPLGIHLSMGGKYSEAQEYAQSLGCTAIQIFTHNPRSFQFAELDQMKVKALRENWSTIGVRAVFSHCNYLINLGTSDNAMWNVSLIAARKELEYARAFGCDYFVLHVGKYKDASVDEGINQVVKALNKLAPELKSTKVMLLLETVAGQGTEIGRTFEELNRIFEKVDSDVKPYLGVCIDTCHIYAAGYDIKTSAGIEKTISAIESTFGTNRVKLIHVNDSKGELGDHLDRHEHIGLGKIGSAGLKSFLTHPKIRSIPKIIETPVDDDDSQAKNLSALKGFF